LEKAQAKHDLNEYCKTIKKRVNDVDDLGERINQKDKAKINKTIEEALDYLEDNPNSSAKEIKEKQREVKSLIDPTISRADAEKKLDEYCTNLRNKIADENDALNKLNSNEKKQIMDATKEGLDWIKKNPNASKEEIDKKLGDLKTKIDPIVERAEARSDLVNFSKALKSRSNDSDIAPRLNNKEKKNN